MTAERIAALPDDDWRHAHPRFQEPELGRNLALARRLGELGEPHGASAGAVAVAWTLANPAVDGAIVGFRNASQVDGILAGATLDLGTELARL
jgi:aryl-alcohol dehydrogenase-like predicted oxidoreductase